MSVLPMPHTPRYVVCFVRAGRTKKLKTLIDYVVKLRTAFTHSKLGWAMLES